MCEPASRGNATATAKALQSHRNSASFSTGLPSYVWHVMRVAGKGLGLKARAILMIAAAVLLFADPAGALPLPAIPRAPAAVARLPLIKVYEVCSVRREGNKRVTRYCDGEYVCDRQNPGQCKAGPELQRRLDEERRKAEEEFQQKQRELDAQLRELRTNERALGGPFRGASPVANSGRAGNCSTISSRNWSGGGAPCQQPRRLSENAYDIGRRVQSNYYRQPPQPPQRMAQANRGYSSLRFALLATNMMQAMARLQPNDPARHDMERLLQATAQEYGKRGFDTAKTLQEVAERLPNAAPPSTAAEPDQSGAQPPQAASQPAPAVAPEPEKPVVAAKDEILCSYLLTFEEGDANRLGVAVPDYCESYLRSIGRQPKDPNAPDPRRVDFSVEDLYQIIQMRKEYEAVFAPDFGE